jgi:lipoprotein-releasing system ATP-binding protein
MTFWSVPPAGRDLSETAATESVEALRGRRFLRGEIMDELQRMLSEAATRTRSAGNVRPNGAPRSQGGLPLEGGPHLLVLDRDDLQTGGNHERCSSATGPLQLQAAGLHKSYRKGPVEVPVLQGVDLSVHEGEFLAIVGQSGSGKSTLLHLLGTLDVPDKGQIHFEGRRIDNLPASGRDALRNRRFGMIFQFYHLLPEMTTLENVLAPLMITYSTWAYFRRREQHRAEALELLDLVGLGHRLKHLPRELSGGEMQRAAIARSLVAGPSLLLADEPTGNLDQETGRDILKILRALNERQKLTIVMVTHDPAIAAQADRTVRLVAGRIGE